MLHTEERHKMSKFENKFDEGFLLGYSTTNKAYRVWNLANGTLEEVQMWNLMKQMVSKRKMRI